MHAVMANPRYRIKMTFRSIQERTLIRPEHDQHAHGIEPDAALQARQQRLRYMNDCIKSLWYQTFIRSKQASRSSVRYWMYSGNENMPRNADMTKACMSIRVLVVVR